MTGKEFQLMKLSMKIMITNYTLKYGTKFFSKRANPSRDGVISCFISTQIGCIKFKTKKEAEQYASFFNQTWGQFLEEKVYVVEGCW